MKHDRAAHLEAFAAEMARADGFVLAFPEYNRGYPGALKNTIDHLYDEWQRKPFAFFSVGGLSGGTRAQENLAPVIVGVGGLVIPTNVTAPAAAPGFDPATLEKPIERMVDDLMWWASAAKSGRQTTPATAAAPA